MSEFQKKKNFFLFEKTTKPTTYDQEYDGKVRAVMKDGEDFERLVFHQTKREKKKEKSKKTKTKWKEKQKKKKRKERK